MLGIVQQQHHRPLAEIRDQHVAQHLAATLGHAQRRGDSRRHQATLVQWRQVYEDHAIRIQIAHGLSHLEGQAGLAHAAGTG
jgi:hypothetical protein